jgi:hypothetical protein
MHGGKEAMMTFFGPVGEAAHGGHSSPTFNVIVGVTLLVLTWVGHFRREERSKKSIWMGVFISAICAVFIGGGIWELLRR